MVDVDPSVARARTTVLLVRHGARYDYANKQQWRDRCARHGHEPSDPPLSALGHEQARETAVALARENPGLILASPYYRVLQTAQPLAHALNVPICVDHCLVTMQGIEAGFACAFTPVLHLADSLMHMLPRASNGPGRVRPLSAEDCSARR